MWPLREATLGVLALLLSPALTQSPVTITGLTYTPAERFHVCCREPLDDADAALLDVVDAIGQGVDGLNATAPPQGFCVPFDVDLLPWVGQEVTMVLHLYEGKPDIDTEIMQGQVTFNVTDIPHPASIAQVGGDTATTASLRVEGCVTGVEVEGAVCQEDATVYFIPHQEFPDPVTLCVNNTIQQCDESLPLTPFNSSGQLAVKVSRSSYTDDDISLFVYGLGLGGTEGGEVVLYLPGEPTTQLETLQCVIIESTCTVDPTRLDDITDFNILAVNLHTYTSLDRPCTDYRVESSQLTSDSIEVRWYGDVSTEYNVTWRPSVGNPVNTRVRSSADSTVSKAYFVALPTGPYTVSVEERSAVPGENVGEYYTPTLSPDPASTVTIIKVVDETPVGASVHTVSVQVTTPDPVTNSSQVNFVVINSAHSSDLISSVAAAEEPTLNISSVPIEFSFSMAGGVLAAGAPITLLLVVRDVDYNLVGLAEADLLLPEFLPQDVAQVGGSGAGAGVRVGPCVPGQMVHGETCTTAGPQYFVPHPNLPLHLQLCLDTGSNSLSPYSPIEQCYNSTTQPFNGLESVTVTLRRSEGRLQHHLEVGGVGQEGDDGEVLYYTSDASGNLVWMSQVGACTVKDGLCSVPVNATNLQSSSFNVLAVALDDRARVLSSLDVAYEDYQTQVVQLASDAVEVVWRATEEDMYRVELTEGGAFSNIAVNCGGPGGADCKAYFVALKVTSEDLRRTASVRRDSDDDGTNVASYDTQLSWDLDAVPRMVEIEVSVEGGEATVSVCPGEAVQNSFYTTTIVDHTGHYIEGDTDDYCLSDVDLRDLDTMGQLWVLVHSNPDTTDPHVPLSTDIFLLDPSVAEGGPRVMQVGSQAVKGEWTNHYTEAVQYTLSLKQLSTTASCEAGQQCVAYLHPDSLIPDASQQASLIEDHRGTVQLVTLEFAVTSIAEISLDVPEQRWDERLKVCFPSVDGATRYELGLEQSGQHVETTHDAAVLSQTSDHVCIVNNSPVLLGAYVELWVLVTVYGDDDSVLGAGETTWPTIFLSADKTVQAAVTENFLVASWHLLHDTASVDQFVVNLRDSSGGDTDSSTVPNTTSSFSFTRPQPGSFTVCVTAMKYAIYSEEVCSGIVTISSENIDVPQLEEVEQFSTASDTMLLTWEEPDASEISGYLVSWEVRTAAQRQMRLPPAALAELGRSRRSLRETFDNFLLMPGTETSVEVSGLTEGAIYYSCVAAVKDDVVSSKALCTTTDLGAHKPLAPPTNLEFDGSTLSWQDGGSHTQQYLVEWRPSAGGAGGRDVVEGTARPMMDLDPGTWTVEVRAASDTSASSAAALTISISGVAIEPEQVGTRSLRVSWIEVSEVPGVPDTKTYLVQVYSVEGFLLQEQTLTCIAAASLDECRVMFYDLDVSGDSRDTVTVTVSSNDNSTYDQIFYTYPLTEVASVTHEVRSSSEVQVEWDELDGANFYLLELFSDDQQTDLLFSHVQTLPTRVTLQGEGLVGTTLTVQGCHDHQHCGDALNHELNDNSPVNWLAVGLGVGLVVVLVAAVSLMVYRRRKSREQQAGEKASNAVKE